MSVPGWGAWPNALVSVLEIRLGSELARFVAPAAAVARSGNVAGVFCGSSSSSSSSYKVVERCRSVLWVQQQVLQGLGTVQERSAAARLLPDVLSLRLRKLKKLRSCCVPCRFSSSEITQDTASTVSNSTAAPTKRHPRQHSEVTHLQLHTRTPATVQIGIQMHPLARLPYFKS